MNILDVLLYPKRLFTKITDKKATFCLGIILIGIIDLSLNLGITKLPLYFTGKPQNTPLLSSLLPEFLLGIPTTLALNFVFAFGLIILIGFIDVLFFSFPIFDLFKFLAGKFKINISGSFIKTAKIYIMTHFIIIPINIIFLLFLNYFKLDESNGYVLLFAIIISIWFSAIITRGLSVLFNVDKRFKGLLFVAVYIWNDLLSMAFSIINGFLLGYLFKIL